MPLLSEREFLLIRFHLKFCTAFQLNQVDLACISLLLPKWPYLNLV